MYVETNKLPRTIQNALNIVNYNKKDIEVCLKTSYSFGRNCYGKGYRAFLISLNLETNQISPPKYGSWGGENPFETKQIDVNDEEIAIPVNCCVISGNQGNKTYGRLYVNPENAVSLLPEKTELSEKDVNILSIMKRYKASYRKEEYRRNNLEVTQEDLNRLKDLGLVKINKAGAVSITTAGKNHAKNRLI